MNILIITPTGQYYRYFFRANCYVTPQNESAPYAYNDLEYFMANIRRTNATTRLFFGIVYYKLIDEL